jgi:hypothetical protein
MKGRSIEHRGNALCERFTRHRGRAAHDVAWHDVACALEEETSSRETESELVGFLGRRSWHVSAWIVGCLLKKIGRYLYLKEVHMTLCPYVKT